MSDLFEKGQIVWDNANTLCAGFKVAETPCEIISELNLQQPTHKAICAEALHSHFFV
jgi:hypothetical protein